MMLFQSLQFENEKLVGLFATMMEYSPVCCRHSGELAVASYTSSHELAAWGRDDAHIRAVVRWRCDR